jgi:hypothetical protein
MKRIHLTEPRMAMDLRSRTISAIAATFNNSVLYLRGVLTYDGLKNTLLELVSTSSEIFLCGNMAMAE